MNNLSYYNEGKPECSRVVLVFSCPGQQEEKENKPVAGTTGRNLDMVLSDLKVSLPDIFPSSNRYDYCITNATTQPLSKSKDKRSEACENEILEGSNLLRLYNEISNYEYVLSFGKNALLAIESCMKNGDVFPIHIHCKYHLGTQGINHIHEDVFGSTIESGQEKGNEKKKIEAENTQKRLKVVSKTIIEVFLQKQSKSACPATSDQPS